MELTSEKQSIIRRLKSAFKPWLCVSVIVGVVILASYAVTMNQAGSCSVTVSLKYDGVESGLDPNGNRFDPSDLKDAELLRLTADAIGQSVTDEDIQRIQDALDIQGNVGSHALDSILENKSIYGKNNVSEFHAVQADAYFPTQYGITFRYVDAGFTERQGLDFLSELVNVYESYFYHKYGYNTGLKQVVSSVNYATYDYIDSVDILTSHLASLRSYLLSLSSLDNTRFVSQASGYSFTDLIGMIDTIQTEDIQWITSYITSNNITKDRNQLIDYYQYKTEDAQRLLAQQDSRLYTLNSLIENYVKTMAVFPIARDAQSSQDAFSGAYEFSQPSVMYDTLINEKVACQTGLADTNEQIALLQRRVERLQSESSSGNSELVESRLSAVNEKITRLLENISLTADEFFKTTLLKDAVQALESPRVNGIALGKTVRQALPVALMAESVLFGLYVLSALGGVVATKRKKAVKTENATDETMKEKVSQ